MAVSYKRLWKSLVDKEMSKSDLRKKAEIAPNTMTKLRRDEEVDLGNATTDELEYPPLLCKYISE